MALSLTKFSNAGNGSIKVSFVTNAWYLSGAASCGDATTLAKLKLSVETGYPAGYTVDRLVACASVIYPGGLENLRLMVRHVGAETTVTRDLVLRGGSGTDTITDGCWVDDAADAFPATAPPGLPLTGTWVPDKPLASFAEAGACCSCFCS